MSEADYGAGSDAPTPAEHKLKLRFIAKRKSDGSQIVSPPLELQMTGYVIPCTWDKDDNPNDADVPLSAMAEGMDGRVVRFVIEEEDGNGGWKMIGDKLGVVRNGVARVTVKVAHPMGEKDPDLTPEKLPDEAEAAVERMIDPSLIEQPHAVRARAELY